MIQALVILFALICIPIATLCIIAFTCFDDTDPDMYPNDNYVSPPAKGYYGNQLPVLKPPYKHQGEKSIVTQWTACGCEKTYTYCLECYQRIDTPIVNC